MTLEFELNEAAKHCVDPIYRVSLKAAAAYLKVSLDNLATEATRENMLTANCAWAHAERVLKECPPMREPTPPSAGRMRDAA